MKKLIKILVVLGIIAVIALVVVIMNLGKIVKTGVEEVGPKVTLSPMTVEKVNVGVLSGEFGLDKFFLGNPEGFKSEFAFKVDKIDVKAEIGSVTSDIIHVNHIRIDGAELCFEGLNGANHQQILENVDKFIVDIVGESTDGETTEEQPKEEKPAKKVVVDLVEITNTTVHLYLLGKKTASLNLPSVKKTDIGKGGEGASMADAFKEIYKSLFEGVSDIVKQSGSILKDAGSGAKDAGKSIVDGVKSLF